MTSERLWIVQRSPLLQDQTDRWGETGETRKGTLSASFISVRFNHRWRSSTTKLAMDLPWATLTFQPTAVGGQRWTATDSSRGSRLSYHFSSAPSTEVRGGTSRVHAKFCDLIVDLWEEWRSLLMRSLATPRQESFIQAATGWFLWGRPLQTQLLHSVRLDTEKIGVHA